MAEIAAASNEQSSGIEQVNQAILQMDEVTQRNAALAEEASPSAEAMQEQALVPTAAVQVFKLKASEQSMRAVSAKPAARGAVALQPELEDEKRLSGYPKKRKLIESKDDAGGGWEIALAELDSAN